MGFMFGSPFGAIGAGAGAILGFLYGHLARRDADAKAEADAQRQEAADADLERQIDERNANGAGARRRRLPRRASRASSS